jgi:hypothetical protein
VSGIATDEPVAGAGRLAELRASARGWHGVQLAVLGFIGLCGVLKPAGRTSPDWLQVLSGLLVLGALVVACLATFLVGRAAWPLYSRGAEPAAEPAEADRAARWLKTGLLLTFVAVGLLALAALSAWWPSTDGGATTTPAAAAQTGGAVELQAGSNSWCGQLADAGPGMVRLVTGGEVVQVQLGSVTGIRAVSGCG